MAYAIEVAGTVGHGGRQLRQRLVDLLGAGAVAEQHGTLVVWATDQAELIGILLHLHNLGLAVDRVERAHQKPRSPMSSSSIDMGHRGRKHDG